MRGVIDLIRYMGGHDPDGDVPTRGEGFIENINDPPKVAPPPPRSIVGDVVVNIGAALDGYRNRIGILKAEIAAKNEQLRQVEAAASAMAAALTTVALDEALTPDEMDIAAGPSVTALLVDGLTNHPPIPHHSV